MMRVPKIGVDELPVLHESQRAKGERQVSEASRIMKSMANECPEVVQEPENRVKNGEHKQTQVSREAKTFLIGEEQPHDYIHEKKRVVLLFGGRSGEHSISCVTAASVYNAIDKSLYEVVPVGITRGGETVSVSLQELAAYSLSGDAAGRLPRVHGTGLRVLWPSRPGDNRMSLLDEEGRLHAYGSIDVVFPVLHGPYGEDGTVQGLFELLSIPYVGCGVLASALCMHKHMLKLVLRAQGLPVAPWEFIRYCDYVREPALAVECAARLGYPLFVKPAREGSSLGVSRVDDVAGLRDALDLAFRHDSEVLLEALMVGRELEVAVLDSPDGGEPRTSSCAGEVCVRTAGFYDFHAKYEDADAVRLQLPASLTSVELATLREFAVRAFKVSGCRGLARVDFFLTDTGPVINEINTMPGFTPVSMYPGLWQESGVSYSRLVSELLLLAAG